VRDREGERARCRERGKGCTPVLAQKPRVKNAYLFLSLAQKKPCQNCRRECELLLIVCATPQLGLVPCLNL
jgi:hypothetical protein